MADLNARDGKLVQYLNEAYGKEKELEISLQAHIQMAASRAPYKKRLQEHLKETKAQARGLERRIKQLGGKAEAASLPGPDVVSEAAGKATAAATKALAAAKGPVHALRGTGEAEKLLKNAKTELWNEHEEIGNYLAIESLAEALRDRDTAKLAREFRRQEERMASFLQKLIPQLTKAVVTEEVPAAQRRPVPALSGNSRSSKPAKSRAKRAKAKPAKRASSSRTSKPAKSRASKPAKSRATSRTAKRAASSSRTAKPAKRASSSRTSKPSKTRAKSRAKSRPAKRAASSSS
jgi:ferritin-like metal-binding protein YciE